MDQNSLLERNALNPTVLYALIESAGINSSFSHLNPLKGGANNRVYELCFTNLKSVILKHYFQHPQDSRPRLAAEFDFLEYAWNQKLRSIPRPLARNVSQNLALYSFISGTLASSAHATKSYVDSAIYFLLGLNRNKVAGSFLLKASEACFDFQDLFQAVESRLNRLKTLPQETDLEKKLYLFLTNELEPSWLQEKEKACKAALRILFLENDDWIITPSDFGLHNTLISSSGKPYFIDFEYAGRDDPAKTICDFFLQPKIPIPFSFFDSFCLAISSLTKSPSKTEERSRLMFPLYKIKWCCIILNVFLRVGKSRREFARNEQVILQDQQLELAKQYLYSNLG